MDFSDLITKRSSIRSFTQQAIPEKKLEFLKRSALLSPTGKRLNHWDFIFIHDVNLIRTLANCKAHGTRPLNTATLAIALIGDPTVSDTWIEDCSIASIYLQLQAEDLGLGSCWIQVHKRQTTDGKSSEEMVKAALNIPVSKSVLSIIAIGHPAETKSPIAINELQWQKIHANTYKKSEQE